MVGARRFGSLDVLKGLAILGVVTAHTLGPVLPRLPGVVATVIASGTRGVQLFFVISATLAFISFDRMRDRQASPSSYYIRKWFRLAPLYYLALAVVLLVGGLGPRYWTGGVRPVDAPNLVAHVLFVHDLNPYWANSVIGIEWFVGVLALFFLAMPLLFRMIGTLRVALVWLVLAAIGSAATVHFLSASGSPIPETYLWREYLNISLLAQFPVLLVGPVVYFLDRELLSDPRERTVRRRVLLCGIGVILVAATGVLEFLPIPDALIFGLAFGAIVLGVMRWGPSDGGSNALSAFGRASYGMYLFHLLVLQAVLAVVFRLCGFQNEVLLRGVSLAPTVILSFLLSVLLFRVVERPAARWGDSLLAERDQFKR